MARFYSVTLRGQVNDIMVVNGFWYRQEGIGTPTEADLSALRAEWQSQLQADWLAMHTSTYVLQNYSVQGYSDQWERAPYLPHDFALTAAGTDVTTAGPPIVAAILGCKVEPAQAARRKRADGTIYTSPVRRGYWAISPINEQMSTPEGTFWAWDQTAGLWESWRLRMAQPLVVTGWADPAVPVVVSAPLKDEVARGYGLIKGCYWNRAISTRRSRKLGKGA